MESKVRHQFDASLVLQAVGSVAITSTASSAAISIYEITKSPYGVLNGRNGIGAFDIVLHVVALDHTTGDETYVVTFESVKADGSTVVTQESVTLTVANVGQTLVFKFQPSTLALMAAGDAASIRVTATLAGTSPILQYWAFVAPDSRA